MKDVRRKCYPIVDLSKFISNKKILSKVVTLGYINFVAKCCPFENLTIELYVIYALDTHVKFCVNLQKLAI